jgi:predicted ATPase/DNA-binding SARP family transcriptional activator
MPRLSLSVLGPFAAYLDERPLTQFRTKSVQALLVYLACQPEVHSREQLMTLLWPDIPQQSAQGSLRQSLYLLRQAIPELPARNGNDVVPLLLADRQTVQMNPNGRYDLDLHIFNEKLKGDESGWAEALALYRGDFLADFYLPDSAPFEEWTLARRADLRRQALDGLETLTDYYAQIGDLAAAETHARRQLEIDNLRESAHRQLMEVLARNGRRAEALSQYEACVLVLHDELAVTPSAPTESLYAAIRDEMLPAIPPPVGGQEWLAAAARDLEREPDLEEAAPSPQIPHNLPVQATPFIGREAELAVLDEFLANPDVRLITIVGPGGMGKTRLALEAAHWQLENFAHGVWFSSLAKLSSPDEIVPATAQALHFNFYEGGTPRQQLLDYFRNKSLLLILDNYEHLLDGADLVSDVLQNAPQVKVVVTSREPLRLVEEQLFHLSGLAFTQGDVVEEDEAVQLFLERAHHFLPGLTLKPTDVPHITTICRQVEGMPLGLELAAAWVDTFSLAEIASELQQSLDLLESDLRNIDDRHRSLRAVFEASWDRLQGSEQQLFVQMSVFRGGFTRIAAWEICAPQLSQPAFHRLLATLTRKSFLKHGVENGRYDIHELMRQFGVEKLDEDDKLETTVRHRHAIYYCEFLHQLGEDLKGPRQKEAAKEIEADLENGRAAWNWAARHKMLDHLQKIVLLWDHFLVSWRSRHQEADSLYRTLIESLDKAESLLARQLLIQALLCRARSIRALGQFDGAAQLQQRAQEHFLHPLVSEVEIWMGKPFVLRCLSLTDVHKNEESRQQGLDLARHTGDRWEESVCLRDLADIASAQGRFSEAEGFLKKALAIGRLIGDQLICAEVVLSLSENAHPQYRFEEGEYWANEGLALFSDLGNQSGVADSFQKLGHNYLYMGQYAQAIKAHRDMLQLYEELGAPLGIAWSYYWLSHTYLHAGEYTKS